MKINVDVRERALMHASALPWVPSPSAGVDRRMLYRDGGEVAQATSVVRYAPGSAFPTHTHDKGEEYFVLEGVFQDEAGDHPVGSYVRNPPGSQHAPSSAPGCTIIVWLRQFGEGDMAAVDLRVSDVEAASVEASPGVARRFLHDGGQFVYHDTLSANSEVSYHFADGGELFVLEGALSPTGVCGAGQEDLQRWSWLRLPPGASLTATAQTQTQLLLRHYR